MQGRDLTDAERAALRSHYESVLEALGEEIAGLEGMTRPVAPDRAIGRLSRLEAINEKSVHEAGLRSARQRQVRVRAALGRLDDPEFGRCSRCDEPIPLARLQSVPGTVLCVGCAEAAGG